jgi:predicted amidophosphoribosyltransferase
VDHFQLKDYSIDFRANQFLILVRGSRYYSKILSTAFANRSMSSSFPDYKGDYDWGFFLRNVQESELDSVKNFLALLHEAICLQDDLTQCFALSYHKHNDERTEIGNLIYAAKPYQKRVTENHKEHGELLVGKFTDFIERHPVYQNADMIIAIPANSDKKFDLPRFIVEKIVEQIPFTNGNDYVKKIKDTKPIKDCTPQEKTEILQDAFSVEQIKFIKNKRIILMDDIYYSGATINAVAATLMNAGAVQVLGLVATKAGR